MARGTRQLALSLKRLIMIRLLVVTGFLFAGMIVTDAGTLLFGMIVAVCILSFVYVIWLAFGARLYLLAVVQIAVDLMQESILIYYTAGLESVYSALVVLTIFSAGLILVPNGALITSLIGSSIFAAIVALQYRAGTVDWLYIVYVTYVKVAIFISVGVLSTVFARRLYKLEQEMRLRENLSFLGEMAAHLAHEIRNPLMSITGAIELLNRASNGKLSGEHDKLMKTITSEAGRLTNMLTHVLTYTHSDEYKFDQWPLNEILDEVLMLLENDPSLSKNIKIMKLYRNRNLFVHADRDRLKQVLFNLVLNGIQAMRTRGGTLSVDTEVGRKFMRVLIRDTGCGMGRDQIKSIFTPFESHRSGGSGIGLVIANKIIQQHGGHIAVESQEGKGSVFSIALPVAN